MNCGKCGAEISDADMFCGKCGAVQERPRKPSMGSPRTKLLAAAAIAILILAGLFGSGLIQQILTGSPLSLPSQSTGTSASSSSATTSRTSAETSNIASTAETTSGTSSPPAIPPPVLASIQNWPSAVGCYHYGQSGWENVTCLSPEAVLKFGHLPAHFLGIGSNNAGNAFARPTRLTYGIVMVNIHNFGWEDDVGKYGMGLGAYSIQLNTNTFTGNNGHRDWVQFAYQDYCGNHGGVVGQSCEDRSRFCVWNIDLTVSNDEGYHPTCVGPGDIPLSEKHSWQWETIIQGWVSPNGNLVGCGWLNGDGEWCVVTPDQYGLATANIGWVEAAGGIMGSGGSSQADFEGTWLQTDIGVNSCPNQISPVDPWRDCGGQPISADDQVWEADTGESSNLAQYDESMTSYYSGSHWWISSASGCNPALGQDIYGPGCSQFVDYGEAFGLGAFMLFTVDVQPATGAVDAGYDTSTTVDVVSVDGVQVGAITMSVSGLSYSGTEDLSGQTCMFSLPLQPGSRCTYTMNIHTYTTAPPGSYALTITGTPPPSAVPAPPSSGLPQLSNSAVYNLIVNPSIPPSPVIVSPVNGASLNVGENTLVGYAKSTDTAELGWVPCSRMQFQVTLSDGSTMTTGVAGLPPPTEDPSYQQTGYCDATIYLSVLGSAKVTLSAANLAGVQGTSTPVGVNIVSAQQPGPFTFALSVTPSSYAIDRGGRGSFTVTVIATGGTPEPVLLSVSGLPQDVTYTLSSTTVTPTTTITTLTLTINAATPTPLGTYPITISGAVVGGSTASTTLQLTVASLG